VLPEKIGKTRPSSVQALCLADAGSVEEWRCLGEDGRTAEGVVGIADDGAKMGAAFDREHEIRKKAEAGCFRRDLQMVTVKGRKRSMVASLG
jgi:hypothetical protein